MMSIRCSALGELLPVQQTHYAGGKYIVSKMAS